MGSKLDDISFELAVAQGSQDLGKLVAHLPKSVKRQIKDLFLELIDKADAYFDYEDDKETATYVLDQVRKEVNDL